MPGFGPFAELGGLRKGIIDGSKGSASFQPMSNTWGGVMAVLLENAETLIPKKDRRKIAGPESNAARGHRAIARRVLNILAAFGVVKDSDMGDLTERVAARMTEQEKEK